MVGRITPSLGLIITFVRDGDEVEQRTARDGGKAAQVACVMIAQLGQLQAGDVMTVTEA
jgi:hypothetical protein